jgi:pyruvate kinase
MLARIAEVVESTRRHVSVEEMYAGLDFRGSIRPQHLIAVSVEASLEYLSPAAVFVRSRTGATPRRLAAFHLPTSIVTTTRRDVRICFSPRAFIRCMSQSLRLRGAVT